MIFVIGSINLDLVANVSRLPGPGETVPGTSFAAMPGGKGANQALAARRAGASVRMIGAVGDDRFADQATALLKEAGVDLSGLRSVPGATGTALILVDTDGENMIAVVPGANGAVAPAMIATADIAAGDIILLQHEVPLATVQAALIAAKDRGATSILNTAPFDLRGVALVASADIVVANETEFDLTADSLGIGGADRTERMASAARQSTTTIIVTLGADGAIACTASGEVIKVAAPHIAPVDTVGAGDTFCGYLAAGLAVGHGLEQAITRSVEAAALACLKPGAQPAIPTSAEVDRFRSKASDPLGQ